MITALPFPESIVFWLAVAVALSLIRPYLPPWAVLAAGEAFSLYWLARILDDGASLSEVVFLMMGVVISVHFWWRHVRGHEWWKTQ